MITPNSSFRILIWRIPRIVEYIDSRRGNRVRLTGEPANEEWIATRHNQKRMATA